MAELLRETYPDAHCELDFTNAYELLVATILSAQSTDRGVNLVTPALFARYPTPAELAAADPLEVQVIVQPTGFFRAKTDHIIGMAQAVTDRFDGEVPATLDELVTLPGVGRKTANVVLGNAFGVPGITPDTHFQRVTRRMGWTSATKPDDIERTVGELFDPSLWVLVSHLVIWHGRRRCHARRPACGACPVAALCPSYGEGPTDPAAAEALVKGVR